MPGPWRLGYVHCLLQGHAMFQSQTRCQAPGDCEVGDTQVPGMHYSGTFPQGHFPGNFPPNGMMANNVPMTRFSPEAFSQEYSLEQQTLRALPVLMGHARSTKTSHLRCP